MKPRQILKGKVIDITELTNFRKKAKKAKRKIVYTAGSWDMIHVGQMRYLFEAKEKGDLLVVGVSTNEAIKKVKGPKKPILDEWMRAEALAFLGCVDFVTFVPMPSNQPILELLQPDIYITVIEDWNKKYKESKEYKAVTEYGGKVELVDRQSPTVSTSNIIARIAGSVIMDILKDHVPQDNAGPLKERFVQN